MQRLVEQAEHGIRHKAYGMCKWMAGQYSWCIQTEEEVSSKHHKILFFLLFGSKELLNSKQKVKANDQ